MGYATVKDFFTGGADEFRNDKMLIVGVSQDFTQSLIRHLIKSFTFTLLVARFVKQQVKNPTSWGEM